MKIAIIGSGIAGLTASHLLQSNGHEVHLFESQDQIGMSAHTIDVANPNGGSSVWGDVPSRMFNGALWPSVVELYRSLGLNIAEVEAAQSYRRGREEPALQFQMPFQWTREIFKSAGSSLLAVANSVGGKSDSASDSASGKSGDGASSNRSVGGRRGKFLYSIKRLRDQGLHDLENLDGDMTFEEYLGRHNFSDDFLETFLYPALSSTVCTCSHDAISKYPAVILLEAMQHITGDQRLCRVEQGARQVAERLSANVEVHLKTPVSEVQQQRESVALTAGGSRLNFDHVVVAVQANQIANLCSNLPAAEFEILEAFEYEDVEVVVHTDDQFMPAAKGQWGVFNFAASNVNSESMCTVWMNQFHTNWHQEGLTQPVFQTIRPIQEVRAGNLIRRAKLQRPLVDPRSWKLWRKLRALHRQPHRRIWFCGSYAMPGIPLLESAVKSAIEISDAIVEG